MGFAMLSATTGTDIISTDSISSVSELISKYGPFIVILAVFIVIFMAVIAYIIHCNQKMNNQILQSQKKNSEANQEMMTEMIKTLIDMAKNDKEEEKERENEEDKKHKRLVSAYIDSSLAFKDASRIAMSKIRCERIAVYLFHNGNSTPYGYSFAKMSCVHEWSMRGSDTIRGRTHANVPLYAFSTIVEALVKDGELAIGNIFEHGILSADEQIFQFVSGSTTRSLFALAIKSKDEELVAFTVAEFKDPQDFSSTEIYNNVKDALKTMNDNIYSIVVSDEYRDNYETNTGED